MTLPGIRGMLRKVFPGLPAFITRLCRGFSRRLVLGRASRFRRTGSGIHVAYLTLDFPAPPPVRSALSHGGSVKMVYLAETFPHSFPAASLLYTVSSVGNPAQAEIAALARRRGIRVVLNQNGVAYPAWHGEGWEKTNAPMRALLDLAQHVIYQSDFCRRSADRYLAPARVGWEVLFNPVDTALFRPLRSRQAGKPVTLLLGGNQYEQYRFDLAVAVLEDLLGRRVDARLVVTGRLWNRDPGTLRGVQAGLAQRGLLEKVEFTGVYSQQDAPAVLDRGDILLHTKNNDPCPGIVSEALACGLPVVYLHSGGTPELVAGAGVGVPVNASWERQELPPASLLGDAVLSVLDRYEGYSRAARQRAVEAFALEGYIQAHRRIFEKVLDTP